MPNPIEIFKPGKHTAMDGRVIEFTEEMLRDAAAAYSPSVHEAPCVVGHPATNDPAYGWIKGLRYEGGRLLADPDQVDTAFGELVNEGKFKKVSPSWYLPDAPTNPTPGKLYLRHLGFLGAQPPAVKGLKSASFQENEQGVAEFADWKDRTVASVLRRLRDFMVDKFGIEDADRALPSYDIDYLQEQAVLQDTTNAVFSEGASMSPAEIAAEKAALEKREQTLREGEATLAGKKAEARKAALVAFAEGLVTEGKLLPKDKATVVQFMELLPEGAEVAEFSEGGAEKKVPALQLFQGFLANSATLVHFGEVATPDKDLDARGSGLKDQEVATRARAYKGRLAQAGTIVSYAEAVDAVNEGKDQSTKE
jgi:hypothetical protein